MIGSAGLTKRDVLEQRGEGVAQPGNAPRRAAGATRAQEHVRMWGRISKRRRRCQRQWADSRGIGYRALA